MTRSRPPIRNRRAARPPRPSPPSASAPHHATCAAPRATSPSGETPSLSTSFQGSGRPPRTAPSLPLGRDLLPPGAHFPVSLSERVEAQLPGRRAKTHLVGQFSAHRRVAEQHLEREAVHERGEVRREALRVARPELARALALPYHLGDRVTPPTFERLALAGRLVVA